MNLRLATPSDCSAVAHIQVDSYRTAYASLMPADYLAAFTYEEQEQDWRDLLARGRAGEYLIVAEAAPGDIRGYALVRQMPPAEDGAPPRFDCELVALHVRPGLHRQGTGRALVADSARRMHALGCRSLGLWVLDGNPACHFYEHMGGVRRGEQFFEVDDAGATRREIGYVWDDITRLF